jgi:hypothetical protein
MDDSALIEELQQKVKEAEELLRRRKEALAALKGKSASSRKGQRERGLRTGSIPAQAQAILKAARQRISLEELTSSLRKTDPSLEPRDVYTALSRYVREGKYFVVDEDGKYGVK